MPGTSRSALVAVLLLTVACKHDHEGHDHSEDHAEGHDHHADDHGHGDVPITWVTRWSERFEIFAEHPPAVVGQPLSVLLHVTLLDGFRPLTEGGVALSFEGPATLRGETAAAVRPGVFRVELTPSKPGSYRGRCEVKGSSAGTVEGIDLRVFSGHKEARAAATRDEDDHGVIEFLKEQQWGVPFSTAFANKGRVAASVEVAGRITTPPGGSADVGAPVTGRIVVPDKGLPQPGQQVRKGQLLCHLVPAPASPESGASAELAVVEAQARAAAARLAHERATRLIKDEAISQRELEDARRELGVARAAVQAAKRVAALFSGARGSGRRGSWRLEAPIAGTVVAVNARPGATVAPGETLFRLVDTTRLWITARIPEQDAARLRVDRDASFRLAGLESWNKIDLSGDDATASIVTVGRTVDPVSRTVDLIYALHRPIPAMRVGGLVTVSVPSGEDFEGVVIPRGALVDLEGRDVVYVQVDGEHFAERGVRVGPREADLVGVRSGLRSGERIVLRGAHLVRLADRARSGEPHGHIH